MAATIHVQSFTFNDFAENTYLLYDESKQCVIIDPGCSNRNEQKILSSFIDLHQLLPVKLINTHAHIDHILGVQYAKLTYTLAFGMHELESPVLAAAEEYSRLWSINYTPTKCDYFIAEHDTIVFGNNKKLQVLLAPGHSPGSLCFYNADNEFVIGGDVLFRQSIGRWDLPGGNQATLLKSIKEKLFTLPDTTKVYSGHGTPTSIGFEKLHNPILLKLN